MKKLTVEDFLKEYEKRDPLEKKWNALTAKVRTAENPIAKKLAKAKLEKFEKNNPSLMWDIQRRRFTSY